MGHQRYLRFAKNSQVSSSTWLRAKPLLSRLRAGQGLLLAQYCFGCWPGPGRKQVKGRTVIAWEGLNDLDLLLLFGLLLANQRQASSACSQPVPGADLWFAEPKSRQIFQVLSLSIALAHLEFTGSEGLNLLLVTQQCISLAETSFSDFIPCKWSTDRLSYGVFSRIFSIRQRRRSWDCSACARKWGSFEELKLWEFLSLKSFLFLLGGGGVRIGYFAFQLVWYRYK